MKKVTVSTLAKRAEANEKLVMSTAYDAIQAGLCMSAGIDFMLVGDSVGMTHLGYANTLPVTMADMLAHTAAVRRGAPEAFVVFDMPFMSYQQSDEAAMINAGEALKTTGADAVKLEGGAEFAPLVRKMTGAGIPVMGHIGLMPQRVQVCGGYKVVGRDEAGAEQVLSDALALQEAGAFAIVLECVPEALAKAVTGKLRIPTIGIGSGKYCSGQVQVITDLLGLQEFKPKHAKRYMEGCELISRALKQYADEVRNGEFPAPENTFQ
ncbi:MAG: 3-methyl-2-oxobutanoate hydroxymethyltransferase [Lentisphaerae bacterium]|nr:3-methyl-2-oxobutanoate hydroxymethyltransferase [Lentisphaerota bacterium]